MAVRFFWDLALSWLAAIVIAGLIALAMFALSPSARAQQPPTSNLVSGNGSATGTGATTIIAAPTATRRIYVTGAHCARSDAGTTAIFVTFNDTSSTIMVLPNSGGGGANNMAFASPLTVPAATAFTFAASANTTTVYCNAQGFTGN
jgi:hypothetical protein